MKRSLWLLIGFGVLALLTPALAQQNAAKPSSPYQGVVERLRSLTRTPESEWHFHADVPHPEDPALNDGGWQTMKVGEAWTTGARVLRRWVEIPSNIEGYDIRGARVKLDLSLQSNGPMTLTVFSNGSIVYHGDQEMQQPITLTESARPGEKYLIAVRADATTAPTRLAHGELLIEPPASRPDPSLLGLEIASAQPLIAAYSATKAEHEQELDAAVKAIDFSPLQSGDQAGFDASLRQAQERMEALRPWLRNFTIRAVGNSHIDMAWLWPWTETVEVVRNTFQSALDLMREYPGFKFTMSSARTYQWMQEKYPDLFQQIEQRVKEGRWEIVGGMWVEPDLNMPAGESLVRQILVGNRYFLKNFGVETNIGWNPDSFGYNWQLPQIYKKAGMDYFVTQKLLWAHDYTTFPYKLFWWEAPDGSKLLTYFPHDYAGGIDAASMAKDLSIWMPSIYGPRVSDPPEEMMHLYGVGDHGGGPTRAMLDNAEQLMKPGVVFPKLEFSTAKDFFADLQKKLPSMNVPTWDGELYFQYHRGVFTTQAETKRRIRQSEEAMLDAEKFASLAMLDGRSYPQPEMERAWKRLLFDHFHDIMPGSGIAVNYLDAARNLRDVRRAAGQVTQGSLREITAHVNTEGPGTPVVVFNPLNWARTEVVEVNAQLPGSARFVEVTEANGKPVPSQLLALAAATHRALLLVEVTVPSMGYSTYFVRGAARQAAAHTALKATPDTLENEYVRLKIDPSTGCMTSLFDKRSRTEALAPSETDTGGPRNMTCGNLLQTFVDKPKQWDAWNIDAEFEDHYWNLDHADEVKLVESGPLRAVIRIKNHFQGSTFVRDVTLYAGVPRVDVKTDVDWHEQHILLKVAFPVSVHNTKASFEIPYGSIERPTTRNTPAEKAQFEVPALRWADLSDSRHGFSLLNNCKYGYDAKGNVLRLSLLRSPTWPDPHADQGHHEFTYSLYPHGGTWREAFTVRQGYDLNYSLIALQVPRHQGGLPAQYSFVQLSPDDVVLTAVKKAEDDNSLIFRFYEWAGKNGEVQIHLPAGAVSAIETNLMEKPLGSPLRLQNGAVSIATRGYEIKTVKVGFAASGGNQAAAKQ